MQCRSQGPAEIRPRSLQMWVWPLELPAAPADLCPQPCLMRSVNAAESWGCTGIRDSPRCPATAVVVARVICCLHFSSCSFCWLCCCPTSASNLQLIERSESVWSRSPCFAVLVGWLRGEVVAVILTGPVVMTLNISGPDKTMQATCRFCWWRYRFGSTA